MPSGAAELGFTLMPMLWGWNQVEEFQSTVVAGYANYVLGMNEYVSPFPFHLTDPELFRLF